MKIINLYCINLICRKYKMDIFLLWDIFFNNDEDDNDFEIVHLREPHLKINNYFENVVLYYSLTGNDKAVSIYYFLHNIYNKIILFIKLLYVYKIIILYYIILLQISNHISVLKEILLRY